MHDASEEERKFIASLADIETFREIKLKDADVTPEEKQKFQQLCDEFDEVF